MDMPASFSSLPPELVAKICSDPGLRKKDLIALRLTGKAQGIHASATKIFAKRFFTDVLLLWNKYSLETFVEICQHPIFGPSVRTIQLSCARYEEDDFYESVRELMDSHAGNARSEFLEDVRRLSERCVHEQFGSTLVSALLDRAFGHLARSNNSFVLAVSADEERSLGRSKVLGPQMGSAGWWVNPHAALGFLLFAAHRSDLKIRKIEFDVEAASTCDLDSHNFVFHEWQDLSSVRSISELTINLWATPNLNEYRNFGILQSLLSLAVHLKILHIRGNVFIGPNIDFRDLAKLISCLPLEELHLASIHMDRDIMTDMLEGLGSNLRRLKLLDLEIWGSWKQILLCIQQHNLHLHELEIDGADREWLWNTAVSGGTTKVRSEVEKLLQRRGNMLEDGESIELGLEYDSQSELDA
jgi:hypothetical protein